MNRHLWDRQEFDDNNPIDYPCPFCKTGVLSIDSKIMKITPHGTQMEFYNYTNGLDYVFAAILRCKNQECKEVISVNGRCLRDIAVGIEQPDGQYDEIRIATFQPKFFYPNLRLFPLDTSIRKEVRIQVDYAFSHYFNDLPSCANRIRNAIELMLDDLDAPRRRKTKAGKMQEFKTLGSRIEHFSKRNVKISKLLLALKIIGNEGSHVGVVEKNDILNAFEILEMLLENTYVKGNSRIFKLAHDIIDSRK